MTYIFWFTLILLMLLIIWMGRRRYIWVRLLTKDFTIKFSGYARNIWLRVGIGNHLARHPKHGPLKDINHSADSYPTYSSNKCLSTSSAHINTPKRNNHPANPNPYLNTCDSSLLYILLTPTVSFDNCCVFHQFLHRSLVVLFRNLHLLMMWRALASNDPNSIYHHPQMFREEMPRIHTE